MDAPECMDAPEGKDLARFDKLSVSGADTLRALDCTHAFVGKPQGLDCFRVIEMGAPFNRSDRPK